MKPQFPTVQEQIDYWNKQEGEELDRVSRIQEAEIRRVWDERNKTWIRASGTVKQGRRPMFQPFLSGSEGHHEQRASSNAQSAAIGNETLSAQDTASNPQEQAVTTAKTLTQGKQ